MRKALGICRAERGLVVALDDYDGYTKHEVSREMERWEHESRAKAKAEAEQEG